jgi:hypothetical protein
MKPADQQIQRAWKVTTGIRILPKQRAGGIDAIFAWFKKSAKPETERCRIALKPSANN